jgi:ATP-dependent DNA ligase
VSARRAGRAGARTARRATKRAPGAGGEIKRAPRLPLRASYPPMEAQSADELPVGNEWRYEPKWDGFRCLAFRDGARIDLRSKAGQPLGRYFPEIVRVLSDLSAPRFVLDGELVIPSADSLSFDDLLMRIHPAESRIRQLARETPALYVVFDLLVDDQNRSLVKLPLDGRRKALESFTERILAETKSVVLSPVTRNIATAQRWLSGRSGLDGVMAKRGTERYRSGERFGMRKIKRLRSADCVVGGFRYASSGAAVVGSLLLGLYDEDGLLHHVGFTSSFMSYHRSALLQKLKPFIKSPGFTGTAPGGPSRWATKRSSEWEPLAPKLVVEVQYDHFSEGRFRHGTKFLRWRPDKGPRQCTMDQVEAQSGSSLRLLRIGGRADARRDFTGMRAGT